MEYLLLIVLSCWIIAEVQSPQRAQGDDSTNPNQSQDNADGFEDLLYGRVCDYVLAQDIDFIVERRYVLVSAGSHHCWLV